MFSGYTTCISVTPCIPCHMIAFDPPLCQKQLGTELGEIDCRNTETRKPYFRLCSSLYERAAGLHASKDGLLVCILALATP